MAEHTTIPLVLIGKTTEMGSKVIEALKPEYEVIHFLGSVEAASSELPLLLTGKRPENPSFGNLGTQDYSAKPQAIVVGSYFTNAMVDEVREKCGRALSVPWMTAGVDEEQRDAMLEQPPDPETYAPLASKLLKEVMGRVRSECKWDGDGVFVYR